VKLLREAAGSQVSIQKVNNILHGHEKQVRVRSDTCPETLYLLWMPVSQASNSYCIEELQLAPSTNLEYNHTLHAASYPYAWKIGV
jgi:hypothetical protein